MIKILRIINIAIFGFAMILLVYTIVFGASTNSKIQEFIRQPGVAEKYATENGTASAKGISQTSPLVEEALKYKDYLNPPLPPLPPVSYVARSSGPAPMDEVIAPKFNLVGTSYYADRPDFSLALIDEPGQGLYWIREGNSIGHLMIDKVNDGSVTVRDGSRTFEMNVTIKELWRDLVKSDFTNQ